MNWLASLGVHGLVFGLAFLALQRNEKSVAGGVQVRAIEIVQSPDSGTRVEAEPPRARAQVDTRVVRESAERSRLPVQGPGTSSGPSSKALAYMATIRERIREKVRYPLSLRRLDIAGTVELELLLDPSGATRETKVSRSSGRPELDQLALEAASEAAPFPPFGTDVYSGPELRILLPIEFRN